MIDSHHGWNTSFKPLVWGFIISIVCTLLAYFLTRYQVFTGWTLTHIVVVIAILEAFALLIFFMHLLLESRPRWNLMMFLFLVLVVVVVIGGTMWIMYNLNYNVMPSMQAGISL